MIVRNYPINTDNVRNVGGKDMILSRMVNHYSALSEAKPVVDTKAPHSKAKKTPHEIKGDLFRREQFHNVREAYKKVSNAKSYIDNKEPTTFKNKRKNCFKSVKEKYEDIEHLRTLKAMSKRILSIGKMHERKKNRFDPIANPTYFFLNAQKRDSNNEVTKLISLKNLNAKLKLMNEDKKNKLLLGNTVYEAVNNIDVDNWLQKCNKNITRPKSAINNYNKSYYDNENNRKNKKLKNNAILEEYNPEKFMKIHKFNRENEGDKIVKRRQKKKAEEEKANLKNKNSNSISKSNSNSMALKSKMNKGLLIEQIPIYIDNEPNGEDYAFNKFNDDVRQFIIVNNIYRDEDYDVLIEELVKKNNNKKNLTRTAIEKTVLDIKNALDN